MWLQGMGETVGVSVPATDEIQVTFEVGGKDDRDSKQIKKTLQDAFPAPLL